MDGCLGAQQLNTRVVDAIRRHCAAHPHAADTLDGVHRWWLADERCSLAEIRAAIAHLVARGELEHRTLADGTEVYFAV